MRFRARDGGPERAGRQWDAYVTGRPTATDDAFMPTIARLHAADAAPAVDPTFAEELLARLITGPTTNPVTSRTEEMRVMEQAIRPAARRAPAIPTMPARRERRGWLELPAILVVIAIVLGAVVFVRGPGVFNPKDEGVVIPAASTPIGPATTEAAVAGPVLMGQARGNAARTGEYPGSGPVVQPEIVWQQEMPGARINPALVVDDGRVFLMKSPLPGQDSPSLWAFDLDTGAEIWTFSLEWTNNRMLAAGDGRVYVSRGQQGGDELVALDAETGEELWAADVGISFWSGPAIANGICYVIGGDEALIALDAETGDERWRFELVDGSTPSDESSGNLASPAVANGVVYAPAYGGLLYAIDAESGEERWRVQTRGSTLTTPSVDSGSVYVTAVTDPGAESRHGWTYAIDAQTGETRWSVEVPPTDANPLVVNGGLIIVSGFSDPALAESENESTLSALSAETGATLWSLTMANGIGDPVVANGVLYVGMYNVEELHAYDAANGELLWAVYSGTLDTEPVIADGSIVASTYNGMLLVLAEPTKQSTPIAAEASADISGLPNCEPTRPNLIALPTGVPALSLDQTRARARGGLEIMVDDIPDGDLAGAEVVAAIDQVLERIADCEQRNAKAPIIPSGFFSDDFYRRGTLEGQVFVEDFGSSLAPLLGGAGSSARSTSEVRELEDGRHAALIMRSETTGYLLVFVEQDGLWLIDEYATIVEVFDQQG